MAYNWSLLTNDEMVDYLDKTVEIVLLQDFVDKIRVDRPDWRNPDLQLAVKAVLLEPLIIRCHDQHSVKELWTGTIPFWSLHTEIPSDKELLAAARYAGLLTPDSLVKSPFFNQIISESDNITEWYHQAELLSDFSITSYFEVTIDGDLINLRKHELEFDIVIDRPNVEVIITSNGFDDRSWIELLVLILRYWPGHKIIYNTDDRDLEILSKTGFLYQAMLASHEAGIWIRSSNAWVRLSADELCKAGEQSPDIKYQLLSGRIFKATNRAWTRMSNFINLCSGNPPIKLELADVATKQAGNKHLLQLADNKYLPVARYGQGMSKGLYTTSEFVYNLDKFCGTFYYLEPDSEVLLAFPADSKFLEALNKTSAAYQLWLENPDIIRKLFGGDWFNDIFVDMLDEFVTSMLSEFSDHDVVLVENPMVRKFSQDFKEVVTEISDRFDIFDPDEDIDVILGYLDSFYNFVMYSMGSIIPGLPPVNTMVNSEVGYDESFMYAAEDFWDQPLCHFAKLQNYEAVLLTNMVGSHQIVFEVLDTRTRSESFSNLRWTVM